MITRFLNFKTNFHSYVQVSFQQPQSFAASYFQGVGWNLQLKNKSILGRPMALNAFLSSTFGSSESAKYKIDPLVQRLPSKSKKINYWLILAKVNVFWIFFSKSKQILVPLIF